MWTKPNKLKSNKRMKSTKISSIFPKRGNRNAKMPEKQQKNKITQGKTSPRVKLASCKSVLTPPPPPVVCPTDRSKAVVPVLVLLFVALWFILRGDLLYVFPCVILFLCFFRPFSIVITSLGEERANLSAFRTFVRFVLV